MDLKKLGVKFMLYSLLVTLFSTIGLAGYTANYTVSDIDDIVIDMTATAMVEVKGDMPTIVDLGVLYLIITILTMIVAGIVALFYLVPKKLGVGKKRI